jgi:hypothetical protein
MTNRVGLWIDRQKAVIVSVSEQGESVKRIESGAKHLEFRGPTRTKTAYNAQYGKGDDQLDQQYLQQLSKYYEKVIAEVRGAEAVLIFGPAEAKTELRRLIQRDKGLRCEVSIETADRMTERQITARVRKFFKPKAMGG